MFTHSRWARHQEAGETSSLYQKTMTEFLRMGTRRPWKARENCSLLQAASLPAVPAHHTDMRISVSHLTNVEPETLRGHTPGVLSTPAHPASTSTIVPILLGSQEEGTTQQGEPPGLTPHSVRTDMQLTVQGSSPRASSWKGASSD